MFKWIIKVKQTYGFVDQTALIAIKLFDKFVSQNELVQIEMHCLIGMCCIILAVKMHENCLLDFEQAVELCRMECSLAYSIDMFHHAEFQIYKQLHFDLNIPTAVDLLSQLVFLDLNDQFEMDFVSNLCLEDRHLLISSATPQIYQCNYEPDISESKSQMSVAVGCLLYQMYLQPRFSQGLDCLFKRLKTLYIPNE